MAEASRVSPIAHLGERYGLADEAVAQLDRLLDLLVSEPLAPTGIRDPRRVIDDHFADSLVALELEVVNGARTLADLGSGAGIPGLPLAIAKPAAGVSLVESSRRKCEFLKQAICLCGLRNVTVVQSRVESWSDGLDSCQLVTARALDSPAVVAEYAAPLLRIGGTLVLWRGRRDHVAEAAAARAMSELGLEPGQVLKVRPFEGAHHRYLHVISKVRATPARYPRRAGIARKRPLGGSLELRSSKGTPPSDRAQR